MAMQELVEEVERSYGETQERMSDPAVYNDHREAAEVGRRLKELEAAHKLAQQWREVNEDLDAARDDGDLRELIPELEERMTALEEELRRPALTLIPWPSRSSSRKSSAPTGRPRSACPTLPSTTTTARRRRSGGA